VPSRASISDEAKPVASNPNSHQLFRPGLPYNIIDFRQLAAFNMACATPILQRQKPKLTTALQVLKSRLICVSQPQNVEFF
jgi:hypothetical protein